MNDDRTPSRTARSRQVERRWRVEAVVVIALIAALIGIAAFATGGGEPAATPAPTPTTAATTAGGPAQLLAFAVTGAPNALLATIGSGGGLQTAAVVVPPGLCRCRSLRWR